MRRSLFCLFMLATFAAHAEILDAGEIDVHGMSGIWLQVIAGNEGLVVKGVLVGELASGITSLTGSPGPFQATVSRVKKYNAPDSDCSLIRIVYKFPATKTVDGASRDSDITWEQDVCLRDYMPRDKIDSFFTAHAESHAASDADKAAMVSGWMQGINEVDQAGMAAIWRQVIVGDEGLVVKAVLTGAMAKKIRETTGSPGPYQATVSRVKKYSEPGCARIRMVYLFPEAKTVDGGHEDAHINYEQNFCLDGHIPRETILGGFNEKHQ